MNVETSNSNNERNVATNVYTNMDVEPVNNSPEHIIGGNTATTITNYHDRRRPASVLTPANTIRRSTRRRRFSNNNVRTNMVVCIATKIEFVSVSIL